jgi:hypothetical protein
VAAALFMLYLGQNHAWCRGKILDRALESTNYTHENTGAGHNFRVPMCESIPKPPYLSGIVTHEDDRTAIFHSSIVKIHFPVSKIFIAFISTSNSHDGVMITPPQQALSRRRRWIFKIFLRPAKLVMINHHLVVFIKHHPGELRVLWS